jgi:hypothetical protein
MKDPIVLLLIFMGFGPLAVAAVGFYNLNIEQGARDEVAHTICMAREQTTGRWDRDKRNVVCGRSE